LRYFAAAGLYVKITTRTLRNKKNGVMNTSIPDESILDDGETKVDITDYADIVPLAGTQRIPWHDHGLDII
jgi:hypothetical protein